MSAIALVHTSTRSAGTHGRPGEAAIGDSGQEFREVRAHHSCKFLVRLVECTSTARKRDRQCGIGLGDLGRHQHADGTDIGRDEAGRCEVTLLAGKIEHLGDPVAADLPDAWSFFSERSPDQSLDLSMGGGRQQNHAGGAPHGVASGVESCVRLARALTLYQVKVAQEDAVARGQTGRKPSVFEQLVHDALQRGRITATAISPASEHGDAQTWQEASARRIVVEISERDHSVQKKRSRGLGETKAFPDFARTGRTTNLVEELENSERASRGSYADGQALVDVGGGRYLPPVMFFHCPARLLSG